MLDAWSAAGIGALGDGFIVHLDCVPSEVRDQAAENAGDDKPWLYDEELADLGYQVISRYEIHEWESSNWSDLEYRGEIEIDPDIEPDYQDETVTDTDGNEHHVGYLVGVFCDECQERIE